MAARKESSGTRKSDAERSGGGKRKESAPKSSQTLAKYQTSQEEMRAANEALRIANEELETAGEELRSSNDQLSRLNSELQQRNRDWAILTNDLGNLLDGVDIPVLVLDGDLRIRRFTKVASMLLKLLPGDVGRPFSDVASAFSQLHWDELFAEVRQPL
jgi:two-component system CheB/CheR fusion protein